MSQPTNDKNWDQFWQQDKINPLDNQQENWSSLSWQHGLRFWEQIFDQHQPQGSLLECGAGSGVLSLHMKSTRGYDCTLLDNSEAGLNLGRQNFNQNAQEAIFKLADVENMPFDDNQFDIIYSGGLLHHFEDLGQVLTEMYRVLKPGGLMAATVIPDKFSCQTLGGFQRKTAKSLAAISHGDFTQVGKIVREKNPFFVNSFSLKQYIEAMETAKFRQNQGYSLGPFPALALPGKLKQGYTNFMIGRKDF